MIEAGFYVSVKNSAGRVALLDGPYRDEHEADLAIAPAARWAELRDARAPWYAYGITLLNEPADLPAPWMRREGIQS